MNKEDKVIQQLAGFPHTCTVYTVHALAFGSNLCAFQEFVDFIVFCLLSGKFKIELFNVVEFGRKGFLFIVLTNWKIIVVIVSYFVV